MIHSSTSPATVLTKSQRLGRITFYCEGPGTATVLLGAQDLTADNYSFKLASGGFQEFVQLQCDVTVAVSAPGTRLSVQGITNEGEAV
jgi:hypothetical protein